MSEHMRVDLFANPRSPSILMKAFPCALGVQPYWIFPLRDEKCWMIIVANIQVLPNPGKGRVGEVHFALPVALPNNLSRLRFPIKLGSIQRQRFGNAHAGNTEDFGQCAVTQTRLRMRRNGGEEALDFFFGQILHLVLGDLVLAYFLWIVDLKPSYLFEVSKKTGSSPSLRPSAKARHTRRGC